MHHHHCTQRLRAAPLYHLQKHQLHLLPTEGVHQACFNSQHPQFCFKLHHYECFVNTYFGGYTKFHCNLNKKSNATCQLDAVLNATCIGGTFNPQLTQCWDVSLQPCCPQGVSAFRNKVDEMVNGIEALLDKESHKECLTARGQVGQKIPVFAGISLERKTWGKYLKLLNLRNACNKNRRGNLRMNNASNAVIINCPPEGPKCAPDQPCT